MVKFINNNPKSIITFLVIILVITIGLIYSYFFIYGSYTGTQSIIVQEVNVDDYFISIRGTTTNSATVRRLKNGKQENIICCICYFIYYNLYCLFIVKFYGVSKW